METIDNEAPRATLYRANLDSDGVFWGVTEIHADDVRDGDVVFDHVPDNAPGKYRWHADDRTLHALPVSQQKQAPSAPDLEKTFDALCEWLSDGKTIPLPAAVEEWRSWYRQTIDSKKTTD